MTAFPVQLTPDLTAPPRARTRSAPLIVLLVLATLPRLGFLAHPFESDGGLYIYMGKVLAAGDQQLYRDFYETKLPGVPLLTAGLYRLFGDHWWPYVLLQITLATASAILLASAARRMFGQLATVPAMAFGVVLLNFAPAVYRGFQLETVQTFLACVAAWFAARALADTDGANTPGSEPRATTRIPCSARRIGDPFLLGLFAAAAAMVKPTAAAVAAAFVIARILQPAQSSYARGTRSAGSRRATYPILAAIAGGTIAPLAVLAWTWRAGLLSEMPALFREISLYGTQTPRAFEEIFKPLFVVLIAGFPFMIVWVFRRDAQTSHEEHGPQAGRLNGALPFAVIWLSLELIGVYVQGRMYAYHFLPVAAPLTLLFAAACARGRRPIALIAGLAPLAVASLAFNLPEFRQLLTSGPRNLATSDYLLAHSTPGDTVVGDGIERLMMETRLRCGSRYAHLFYFANHDAAPLEFGERFLDDLDRDRPTWAVFETDRARHRHRQADDLPMYLNRPARRAGFLAAWDQIDAYVDAHYVEVTRIDGTSIYRRTDAR